jgi:hypothetical protein
VPHRIHSDQAAIRRSAYTSKEQKGRISGRIYFLTQVPGVISLSPGDNNKECMALFVSPKSGKDNIQENDPEAKKIFARLRVALFRLCMNACILMAWIGPLPTPLRQGNHHASQNK